MAWRGTPVDPQDPLESAAAAHQRDLLCLFAHHRQPSNPKERCKGPRLGPRLGVQAEPRIACQFVRLDDHGSRMIGRAAVLPAAVSAIGNAHAAGDQPHPTLEERRNLEPGPVRVLLRAFSALRNFTTITWGLRRQALETSLLRSSCKGTHLRGDVPRPFPACRRSCPRPGIVDTKLRAWFRSGCRSGAGPGRRR